MESDKELYFKMNILEQYMKNMQQQIEAVENEIAEMNMLKESLKELENSKEKEIFASVGKNIFAKAKIISNKLLVNIGDKNLVEKSVSETREILENQTEKLEKIKKELYEGIEKLDREAISLLSSMEKKD